MSLNSILNIARQAMNVQQVAIQTASHNISNAQTVGYSRQRVDLRASLPVLFPYGSVGTGVTIAGITRARDALLDGAYRNDSADASNAETTSSALGQIQSVFGEPSDTGLSASLDAFWSSWSDLAGDPTSSAAKSVVRQAGNNVATTLNRFAAQIDQLDQYNRAGMDSDVREVNAFAQQIAGLNTQIISTESNGSTANDLRDQRDLILDKLSSIVGGQIVEHTNGAVAVYAGGRLLIDGATVNQLQMTNGQPPSVSFVGSASPISAIGGTLAARINVTATQVPLIMSKLDALAKGLVESVNAIHSGATTYSGNPPVAAVAGNFFDVTIPAPVGTDTLLTARGIRLSSTLAGPNDVAASATAATGPGNNAVATALAALRSNPVSLTALNGPTTATFNDFFNETVGSLATSVKEADNDVTVHSTLASNADIRRQSVSSVSTDEELISLIEHQHAYQAAARLVTVVDEMADILVNLGR